MNALSGDDPPSAVVERPPGADVDGAAHAALEQVGLHRLVHLDRLHEFGLHGLEPEGPLLAVVADVAGERLVPPDSAPRPLTSTRVNCGPRPRIETAAPSPRIRSMATPETRCSDSARFWSGNLPMSSATSASMMLSASRFMSRDWRRLPRMPVTTTSSMIWSSSSSAKATCTPGRAPGRTQAKAAANTTARHRVERWSGTGRHEGVPLRKKGTPQGRPLQVEGSASAEPYVRPYNRTRTPACMRRPLFEMTYSCSSRETGPTRLNWSTFSSVMLMASKTIEILSVTW